MSLTSYRAAPPRASGCRRGEGWRLSLKAMSLLRLPERLMKRKGDGRSGDIDPIPDRLDLFSVPGGPGGDRLSHVLRQSTIGAKAFDGRVRDGIGSYRLARATRPARNGMKQNWVFDFSIFTKRFFSAGKIEQGFSRLGDKSNQVERAISTGKLHALPRFHIRPINVVVFHGSSGRTCFEAGFPLRCFQRLSIPYIATLHRRWRDDRSTRDTFTPVLSY